MVHQGKRPLFPGGGRLVSPSWDPVSLLPVLGSLGPWGAAGWSMGGDMDISIEAEGQEQRRSVLLCNSERK